MGTLWNARNCFKYCFVQSWNKYTTWYISLDICTHMYSKTTPNRCAQNWHAANHTVKSHTSIPVMFWTPCKINWWLMTVGIVIFCWMSNRVYLLDKARPAAHSENGSKTFPICKHIPKIHVYKLNGRSLAQMWNIHECLKHLFLFISGFNQLDAQNLFHDMFYFISLHVSSTCAHHQEVKTALHSLWYHHTETSEWSYRFDDTRGCLMQFWPSDDEHMCSKHVEAWNKTYCETNFLHHVG